MGIGEVETFFEAYDEDLSDEETATEDTSDDEDFFGEADPVEDPVEDAEEDTAEEVVAEDPVEDEPEEFVVEEEKDDDPEEEEFVVAGDTTDEPTAEDLEEDLEDEILGASEDVEEDMPEVPDSNKLHVDEAIERLSALEGEVNHHQHAVMNLRWSQGEIVFKTKIVRGENTMEKLSEATGVHENTLRECRRLYEKFKGDHELYEEWLAEDGGTRRWYEVQNLIRSNSDTTVLTPERLKSRMLSRIEKTAMDLQKLNEEFPDDPEVEGVAAAVIEEYQHFARTIRRFDEDDPATPRSETYMEFIRRCPCAVRQTYGVEPHHTATGGTGMKGSDLSCIPLDPDLHREYHDIGKESFEKKYDVSMASLVAEYQHRFMTGTWLFMDLGKPQPRE